MRSWLINDGLSLLFEKEIVNLLNESIYLVPALSWVSVLGTELQLINSTGEMGLDTPGKGSVGWEFDTGILWNNGYHLSAGECSPAVKSE